MACATKQDDWTAIVLPAKAGHRVEKAGTGKLRADTAHPESLHFLRVTCSTRAGQIPVVYARLAVTMSGAIFPAWVFTQPMDWSPGRNPID